MKSNKLIIENHTELKDIEILQYIMTSMAQGLFDNHYCYITLFKNKLVVDIEPTKYGNKIYVYKESDTNGI